MDNINLNTQLEIALEIISTKIAEASRENDMYSKNKIEELLKEREEMYLGNTEIIKKIIEEYGPSVKKKYENI